MSRPIQYAAADALSEVIFVAVEAIIALPALLIDLAVKATQDDWQAARRAVDRQSAQSDRAFAKRCTARLEALRGAPPSAWRRAVRELARERRELEDARKALSDAPCAVARREAARGRRNEAWRAWFEALEREVAETGSPSPDLIRRNPMRRGAPIRRLCERSVNPPPTAEALLEQYGKARGRGRVEEKIRLGSMLLDAEATVDSSLIRDEGGEIVGRNPGLRGWLAENCPELLPHYGALLGYRRMAADLREANDVEDPCPAALLLASEPETERKLPPAARIVLPSARRRVRERLRAAEAEPAKTFAEALRQERERRQRERIAQRMRRRA